MQGLLCLNMSESESGENDAEIKASLLHCTHLQKF